MANRDIRLTIRMQDQVSRSLRRMGSNIRGFRARTSSAFNRMSVGLTSFKGALLGVGAVMTAVFGAKALKSIVSIGSEFENLTTQFIPLLGSLDEADKRMKELANFAATTPFQLAGVAKASKILETLTEGTLSTGDGLRLVGDAAAISGEDFANLSVHVGRAFSSLQANRPAGEALARLQELGLVTGNTRTQIEALQGAAKGKEAWNVLEDALKASSGGMDLLSKTASGLSSTIQDQLAEGVRQIINEGLWAEFTSILTDITSVLDDLLKDGSFKRIGEQINQVTKFVKAGVFELVALWNITQMVGETIGNVLGAALDLVINQFKTFGAVVKAVFTGDFKSIPELIKGSFNEALSDLNGRIFDTKESFVSNTADISKAWRKLVTDTSEAGRAGAGFEGKKKSSLSLLDVTEVKEQSDLFKTLLQENRAFKLQMIDLDLNDDANSFAMQRGFEMARFNERMELLTEQNETRKKIIGEDLDKILALEINHARKVALLRKETDKIFKAIRIAEVKDEEMSSRKKAQIAFQTTDNLLAAGELFLGGSKKNAKLLQAISIGRAIVSGGEAAINSFNNAGGMPFGILPMLSSLALTAAQISTMKGQAFGLGGILPGANRSVINDRGGSEGILTAQTTSRIGGIGAINSLNNRNAPTRNITAEIHYSPTNNITSDSGDSTSITQMLERDKEGFAKFIQNELIDKDYLTIGSN